MSVISALDSLWMSSIVYFTLGLFVGVSVLIFTMDYLENPIVILISGIIGILSILAILSEHKGFDSDANAAYSEAFDHFHDMKACQPMNHELRELRKEGLQACVVQGWSNQADAILKIQQARLSSPPLSLIDGIRSQVKNKQKDWCAETFRAASQHCKDGFITMSEASKNKLLSLQ